MKTRSYSAAAVVAVCATLALTGCNRDTAGATGSAESTTIGFSAGFLDAPFNSALVRSITDQANSEGSGLNMMPATDAQSDPAKQVTDVNALLSQGAKGIILFPTDSDAIVPAIEAANAQNVPVVTTDIAANGGEVYMNIRADNLDMGVKVCEQMGELTGGTGRVLEIHGDLGTSSGYDRNKGFNDCMKEKYPNVEIVSKDAKWKTDQAVDVAQTQLTTSDYDGIFLASDSVMLNGVQSVLQDTGKLSKAGEAGHIPLVTIDGTTGALQAVRDGYVDAVISQPLDLYGQYAVSYMNDALAGKEYSVGPTDHGSEIVEYEGNLADMLPATVVTPDNVDDASLWGNSK